MTPGNAAPKSQFMRSAFWAVLAAISFAFMMTSVRSMEGKFDAFEIVFFRAIIGLFMVIPLVSRSGIGALKTEKMPLHIVRTLFALFAMATLYYALADIPVAHAIALTFLIPLFTTIAAGVVLRESVGIHRWSATLVGFAGAMIIIRPGIIPINLGTVMILIAAFLYSCAHVVTKRLSDTESGTTVVFYMSVTILIYSAIPAFFVWQIPTWADMPAMIGLGITGYATHYCITRSLAMGDASFVIVFDFMRLPFSLILGWLLFREILDFWTCAGALIIFAAGYYSTVREAKKTG